MKFKKLNEEFTSDDLYQELIDAIYDRLENAVDNLAIVMSSEISDYDADYCSEEPNRSSMNGVNSLRKAAEYFAEFLLENAPEVIHESLEANDEDGWGEDVRFALEDMFDSAENIMYEVRNCVRGSYTRVDTVEELADKIRQMCQGFEVVADQLEDESEALQERLNEANIDFYKDEPSDEFDASAFIGKPLKDFLKTIDHRTKINISSEGGFDSNGGKGNTAGMSGLAHDAGWYLADKLITDIKVPQDKRFYDYSIFIEGLEGE